MNRISFRGMVCILPILLSAVSTARGDDKAVGKRPIRASETLGAQRYAVIIGINDYRDDQIPDLKFAEGDAQAVYDVLTDPAVGGIKKENATLLLGKSATTRNIRKALAELRTIPKDATVFIFFSGHGAKEAGEAFWVTYDSELGGLAFSAVPDREIRALTDRIPSSRLIMLLDCCYAAATVKEQKSVVDLGDILKKFVGKGRVIITASGSGEEAIEAKDLKRGVFTYYLLEALRGAADGTSGEADGIVTVPELTAYIDKTVAEAARRRKGIQKPAIFMEEVQDPAKFLVTIDPAKMASLAAVARRQTEQVKARLGVLKRLFIDEKLTADQYRLGKDLFGRDPGALSKQDRERVEIFIDLVESKIPARRLRALLDSVESPAQRAARLERERVAAEVKTTLVKLRRAFDRKDGSRAYKLFETLKRLSPDDPSIPNWQNELEELSPKLSESSDRVYVKMSTTMGDITLELNQEKAPITVENFLAYCDSGFYEGTIFHRVINEFMIQGGGFDQAMTKKQTRDGCKNEWRNGLKNKLGTIAMARLGGQPDSATSQFFINVKDNAALDMARDGAAYAVFGSVIGGMDAVNKIKLVSTKTAGGMQNVPVEPVIIKKVTRLKAEDCKALIAEARQ